MQDTPRLLISMRSCAASRSARSRTQIANTNQFCRARKQMKINSAKKTKRHVYSLQASDVEYGNKTRRCEARRATSCVFLSSWSYRSLSSMEHCEKTLIGGSLRKMIHRTAAGRASQLCPKLCTQLCAPRHSMIGHPEARKSYILLSPTRPIV